MKCLVSSLESSNMKDDWECKYSKLYLTVLTTVILLYFRSSDFIHLTAESLYPFTKLFPFSPASSLWLLLFNSLFEWVLLFCFLIPHIYDTIQSSVCLCLALSLSIKPKGLSILSHHHDLLFSHGWIVFIRVCMCVTLEYDVLHFHFALGTEKLGSQS